MIAPPAGRGLSLLAAALLLGTTFLSDASSDDAVTAGRRIYREGLGSDNGPVSAVVQGDVSASGATLACVGCHKRSGLGSYEAGVRAPAVTGPALFGLTATNGARLALARKPYTDKTLSRAITQGVASDGQILSPLMPRYQLTKRESRALVAYLRVLGGKLDPGVGDTDLELATIVSASAPAREREAVAAVVQRFAEIKNSGTRQEQRRAAASRRHPYGEKHVRAFRRWNLALWTLEGPTAGWRAQLEERYKARPPFAVISGATGPDWQVVHEFCERHEVPCILPVTDLPVETGAGHYTIYYSAGVRLDARVTARNIADNRDDPDARIAVAYTDDARGRAALRAFAAALPEKRRATLTTRPVAPDSTPNSQFWTEFIQLERPDQLVAWLNPAQFETLVSVLASAARLPRSIYTAASFTDWQSIRAAAILEQRVLHVFPYALAANGLAQFPREEAWLNHQNLAQLDRIPAAEALFACHVTGEAMAVMSDNYSREYLIESLEHMLDGTGMSSTYPVMTLGTSQRFLAKGAHVLRLAPATGASRYVSTGWFQP
jgi:hypothetical protein